MMPPPSPAEDEFLSGLNPAQCQAVCSPAARLLIVAGPGTGKTHTLTRRIARQTGDLPAGKRILAITFTKKAAGELRERLGRLGGGPDQPVEVGTFHQFCAGLLRRRPAEAGVPDEFRVAAPEEIEALLPSVWPEVARRDRAAALAAITAWKSQRFAESPPPAALAYQQALRAQGWLDFDDLLFSAWRLLRDHPSVLAQTQAVYQGIFVDEYQDINPIQHALIRQLAGEAQGLTVIGDPHQAIYGFRGADPDCFARFTTDFPGAEVLTLRDNYRSGPVILTASGQVMAGAGGGELPELTARILAPGRLTTHAAATDRAEAEYVVHHIERLVGGTSMFSQDTGRVDTVEEGQWGFGDIAVLYRLHHQARPLVTALERSGMPYVLAGPPSGEGEVETPTTGPSCPPEVPSAGDKITLMTLHAAKGLEFPVVFMLGCEEGLLPLQLAGLAADPDEERRLFYVGMTRARERLFLVRAERRMLYGKTCSHSVSRFVTAIEERLKENEAARARPRKTEEQLGLF